MCAASYQGWAGTRVARKMGLPSIQGLNGYFQDNTKPMWEGACPRWLSVKLHQCWLTHRYRGQAPSHT